jgi:hypothetical protein
MEEQVEEQVGIKKYLKPPVTRASSDPYDAFIHAPSDSNMEHMRQLAIEQRNMGLWEATVTTNMSGVGWGGQEAFIGQAYKQSTEHDTTWSIEQEDPTKDGVNFFALSRDLDSGRVRNHESYLQMVERSNHYRDATNRISETNWATSMLYAFPAQFFDPINAPEFALGFMTGGWGFAARVATGAVAVGGTAYVQESIIQDKTSTHDEETKRNSALFGALLGSVFYGFAGAGVRNKHVDVTEIADSVPSSGSTIPPVGAEYAVGDMGAGGVKAIIVKADDSRIIKGENSNVVKEYDDGTLAILGEIEAKDVPSMGSRFAWSLHGRMMKSKSDTMRALGAALDISGAMGTRTLVSNDTMSFVADKVKNKLFQSVGKLRSEWVDTFQAGKMDEDTFWSEVYVQYASYKNNGVVDKKWDKSIVIVDDIITSMGKEMQAAGLDVKEVFDINRMYNIDKITDMDSEELIELLSKGLSSHESRRGMEGLDAIATEIGGLRKAVSDLKKASVRDEDAITVAQANLDKAEAGRAEAIQKVIKPLTDKRKVLQKKRAVVKAELKKKFKADFDKEVELHNADIDNVLEGADLTIAQVFSLLRSSPVEFVAQLTSTLTKLKGAPLASAKRVLGRYSNGESLADIFKKRSLFKTIDLKSAAGKNLMKSFTDNLKTNDSWMKADKAVLDSKKAENAAFREGEQGSIREQAISMANTLRAEGRSGDFSGVRSRNINTAAIKELLITDMRDMVAMMARDQSGTIALGKVYGIKADGLTDYLKAQKAAVTDELEASGMVRSRAKKQADKEIKLLEKGIKLRLNTQLTPKDPNSFWQGFKVFNQSMNMSTLGGGMSSTALQSEIGVVIARGSMGNALKHVGLSFGEFRNLITKMPPSTDVLRQIQLMTGAFDVFNGTASARAIDGHDVFLGTGVAAKAVRTAQGAAEGVAKWTGLSTITSAYRMALGSTVLEDLFFNTKLVTSLSKHNESAYTRLQVDVKQIHKLQSKASEVFELDSKGGIVSMDLSKLNDPALENMVHRALNNVSHLDILKGDKMHLPEMFSNGDNVLLPLLTQFLSYPMQAYESLLIRGASEFDARIAAGISASVAFSSFLGLAKEEMEVKMGVLDNEARRYGFDTAGLGQLAINATNKGAITSPISSLLNYITGGFTGGRLGSDWQSDHFMEIFGGPTASRMQSLYASLNDTSMNPFDLNSNAWRSEYGRSIMLNSFLPMYTLPVVGKYMQELNKDAQWN